MTRLIVQEKKSRNTIFKEGFVLAKRITNITTDQFNIDQSYENSFKKVVQIDEVILRTLRYMARDANEHTLFRRKVE